MAISGGREPTSVAAGATRTRPGRRARWVIRGLYAVYLVGLAELGSCLVVRWTVPEPGSRALSREAYAQALPRLDPALGWQTPDAPREKESEDCLGRRVVQRTRDGRRVTPMPDGAEPRVALFGDSYAFGDEVGDADTVAAALSTRHGLPTLNYGVNAYGPAQMLLRYRRVAPSLPPSVDFVVFQIFSDNIYRLVNRYRPVFLRSTGFKVWKPYYWGGRLHVPDVRSYEAYVALAEEAFRTDYWATPEPSFPFTFGLARLATTPYAVQNLARVALSLRHRAHAHAYATPELAENMDAVIRDMHSEAAAHGHRPLVFFVLHSELDEGSVTDYVRGVRRRLDVRTVDSYARTPDWSAYRLAGGLSHVNCHPSPAGYAFIASEIHRSLEAQHGPLSP